MKILRIVFILIAITFIGVFSYYQIRYNSNNGYFKNIFGENTKKEDIVFSLSNIHMTLKPSRYSLDMNAGTLKVDFIVENISAQPQLLYPQNISVFDSQKNRHAPSLDIYSKINPLVGYDEINPKTKKNFSLIFEVPINEVYSVGYSDNMERVGKQIFIDDVLERRYEYVTIEDMIKAKKNSDFLDISLPQDGVVPINQNMKLDLEDKNTSNNKEVVVDLNDYFGSPDEDIDWNYMDMDENSKAYLKENGIYFSTKKNAWVKLIK